METSMMFWSVLGAVLLLVLAAAIYRRKRSSNRARNSQHGQPMKNVEGATHAEQVARNPNIMGGGGYFR
jgi:LPXTG-motif cell wall-anchored protein